ncbi:MAG: hypothetical protein WAO98_04210 [Alphaproteobacteria bacterium]
MRAFFHRDFCTHSNLSHREEWDDLKLETMDRVRLPDAAWQALEHGTRNGQLRQVLPLIVADFKDETIATFQRHPQNDRGDQNAKRLFKGKTGSSIYVDKDLEETHVRMHADFAEIDRILLGAKPLTTELQNGLFHSERFLGATYILHGDPSDYPDDYSLMARCTALPLGVIEATADAKADLVTQMQIAFAENGFSGAQRALRSKQIITDFPLGKVGLFAHMGSEKEFAQIFKRHTRHCAHQVDKPTQSTFVQHRLKMAYHA